MAGTAFLTGLLDLFGIASSLNWMVWSQLGLIMLAIDLIYLVIMLYAYDAAVDACRQDGTAAACLVQLDMVNELKLYWGTQAFARSILVKNADASLYANKDFIEADEDASTGLFSLIQF